MFNTLVAYLDSIKARDPAPRSRWEILLYPGLLAVGMHRVAHWLFEARLFFLARFINHLARFLTGIDIHPGATIGRHLFIDHGFGVVIGETAEIGDNVSIYQGVTLGGTDPANGIGGKRHPTLSNDVIVGSGAQILGPVIVNERARVGANAVVTKDVPEGAVMVGIPARSTLVDATEYAREFVPYGTPCCETFDPATQKVELLQCQLEQLQKQLAALIAEREAAIVDNDDEAPQRRKGSRNRA
ncbi:serine O-acetyltransferase [Sphingopyxis indica]|uniref:Serine acetyltransferase n=1 Tax=Sphingopyxis indica TaxID=436663 RepID=A0A239LGC3_9SPHN|nr:serine O-acetyltransferase [Sphingopyxis indica]WOF41889.1 serine O-acetyltransferase [Sphingopyxis indica]SNT28958.1 serine O-acetyltransferase [Sphingopyxis indica]